MITELSPSIPDLVEYQLPPSVNTTDNALFIALLKQYYDWMVKKGQPTEFLHNLMQYKDVDLTSSEYRSHLITALGSLIPTNSNVNTALVSKHIGEFLSSKGTFEAFQFIMNAVYGEDSVEMEWLGENVIKPSSNKYERVATLAIESLSDWVNVEGSSITQYFPSPAEAVIESCVATTVNGKKINWLHLQQDSVIGQFVPNGKVSVLHNTINRNWYNEQEYYFSTSLSNDILTFKAVSEESRPYNNLIVKQLGSDFRAVVDTLISRSESTNATQVQIKLKSMTGTFVNGNEIYIFPVTLESIIFTKDDFEYGLVSPSVESVKIETTGSLYTPGDLVTFFDGSGNNVDAYVSEITTGGITSVDIVKKGYGYSVGDKLIVNEAFGGIGLDVEVSSIDGIDGAISLTSELNSTSIINGGYDYAVNDEIEIVDGIRVAGIAATRLRVSSVNSTWGMLGIRIDNGGTGYPPYTSLSLIDTTTRTEIAGLVASPKIVNGVITDVTVSSMPAIATANLAIAINGYGAAATATVVAGVITAITINVGFDGLKYIDPIVTITGNGIGASATATATAGVITAITVKSGGSGYTTANVTISERYGSGAVLVPKIRNQTAGTGTITGLSVVNNGEYTTLPNCWNVYPKTMIGIGKDARINLDFKAKNISLDNSGHYYKAISTTVSGIGSGAYLVAEQILGVIAHVAVISGGHNYSYNTTISIPTTGGVPCVLSPVIVNGIISSVTVVSGGSGYVPPELSGITISSGTNAVVSSTISGTGKLVNYDLVNAGTGYKDPTELPPLTLTVSGGSGARLLPSLSEEGFISRVDILDGGTGYSITDTITVTGGGGSLAQLHPVVVGGRVTDVTITNAGAGYKYGTSIIVLGDGTGAAMSASVETGITSVSVVSQGTNYPLSTTITITDPNPLASGAEVRPIILSGKIVDLVIVKKGSGYTLPVLTLSNNAPGTGAVLTATASRFVKSATITNAGTGYTYADAFVVGDGELCDINLSVEHLGSIDTATLSSVGSGYTTTPIVNIKDTSNYGAVSSIRINSIGQGFRKLPVLTLANKTDIYGNVTATGTKFICFGENVGGVRRIGFIDHGADYYDLPKAVFPLKAVLKENVAFRLNEVVYASKDPTIQSKVKSFDFDRNLIEFASALTDDFLIVDELANQIITENGLPLVDEVSGTITVGDVITGQKSHIGGTIYKSSRAGGTCTVGGNGWSEFKFVNDVGMLNRATAVIHDNHRYQDMAYLIRCGRAMIDYADTLKNTTHPAGYAMFGEVKTQTMLKSDLLNEIGYNALAMLLIIYSIADGGFGNEYSTMNELFGEQEKFKHDIPIDLVKNEFIYTTSEYLSSSIPQYPAEPLNYSNINTWTKYGSPSIVDSAKIAPSGLLTAQHLSDSNQIGQSYIGKTFTSVIGNTYTIETFIGKQVNPQSYAEISIGTEYVRINTETGISLSSSPNINIEDVGDYWWIRIPYTATTTSFAAAIYPARGRINSLGVVDSTIVGSVSLSDTYVRNTTGLTAISGPLLKAWNSNYIPKTFRFLTTTTDVVTSPYP